jgi:hypothetical protein
MKNDTPSHNSWYAVADAEKFQTGTNADIYLFYNGTKGVLDGC